MADVIYGLLENVCLHGVILKKNRIPALTSLVYISLEIRISVLLVEGFSFFEMNC
jgi:hypothetical protein